MGFGKNVFKKKTWGLERKMMKKRAQAKLKKLQRMICLGIMSAIHTY